MLTRPAFEMLLQGLADVPLAYAGGGGESAEEATGLESPHLELKRALARLGADPSRAFVPRAELTALAAYEVPVLAVLEDAPVKTVTVYRLR